MVSLYSHSYVTILKKLPRIRFVSKITEMSVKDFYIRIPVTYIPKTKNMKGKQILVTLDDEFLDR
jgi:hypothetical protein